MTAMSTGGTTARGSRLGVLMGVLRILGAALLLGLAWIHWHLWQQGYDSIDVIGPAFLASVVLGVGGALLVLVSPLRFLPVAAVLVLGILHPFPARRNRLGASRLPPSPAEIARTLQLNAPDVPSSRDLG